MSACTSDCGDICCAEVERLTKERDEARAHSPHNYVHRALYEQWKERAERAEKERDALKAALRECVGILDDRNAPPWHADAVQRAREALGEVES